MRMRTSGRTAASLTVLPICMTAPEMVGSPTRLTLPIHTELRPQYLKEEDLNNDGKISFREYETEIMGTYDLATNTWNGGVIDARTFQRNNGEYVFDLSESNGVPYQYRRYLISVEPRAYPITSFPIMKDYRL